MLEFDSALELNLMNDLQSKLNSDLESMRHRQISVVSGSAVSSILKEFLILFLTCSLSAIAIIAIS